MKLEVALGMLPEHQRKMFTFQVDWWVSYYVDYDLPHEVRYSQPPLAEEYAVELAFAAMRREGVLYRTPWGAAIDQGHWCRGWSYCFRCYGD
jgi:hypothetical protein